MKSKKVVLGIATAACLLASPAFAAKTALSNTVLGDVTGKANNTFTAGAATSMTVDQIDARSNAQIGFYQWSDDHSADVSLHKGANDQSGSNSHVQGIITGEVNSLAWGWVSQNGLNNTGTTTLTGTEMNMAYGTTFMGGF